LRIVTTQGWSAEGLQAHYGANAVYQLTHTPETVRLEARAPGMSCTLRAPRWQPAAARALLGDAIPRYTLATRQLLS
jgi:hypothetical protein